MYTLLIGYDLNKQGQNYDGLIKEIKSTGTYWHSLDSTWLVRTSKTAEQFRDRLLGHIDQNDELLVINVSGDSAAWYGFEKKSSDWLLEYLG